MTTPTSTTIYASRDAIRTQVVEFLQQYMELNDIDLVQSSFLSYVIDILTTLSSNLMFYQTNIYKEFFLTKAQLPESVHNLSSFLGYNPVEATYAKANVLITVPLPFTDDTEFNIKEGFEFSTGDDIKFITYYNTKISITGGNSVSIQAVENLKVYEIPVILDLVSDQNTFKFVLPVRQYEVKTDDKTIDSDLQVYQFTDVDFTFDGKLSSLEVYVRTLNEPTDTDGELWNQFDSLYLMSSTDKGYVARRSPSGRKIYFGNGIIGEQPEKGSTINVRLGITKGSVGNVIAGSIINGGRIYCTQNGETTIVNYTVTNPSPAFGGADEEDLQQIRSNSIQSLTSLNRLVSEQDYKKFEVVIPGAPVYNNTKPVLKRSDLKINEIQLFTILKFGEDIVPTVNSSYTIPTSTLYIPRDTVITIDNIDFITLFEMTVEGINTVAYYHYIMREISLVPTLIQSWGDENNIDNLYYIHVNNLEVTETDPSNAKIVLSYTSTEPDFADCTCAMKILSTNDEYSMINVPGTYGGTFEYEFSDYMDIPVANQTYYFKISNPNLTIQAISEYSASFTFRQDLKSYMISNTVVDSTATIIYDIPVIKKSYYDSINKIDFESQVLQTYLDSFTFKNYRMLTDFINIKLCNTTGLSKNMLFNDSTIEDVQGIGTGISGIPTAVIPNERWIVSGYEGGDWNDHKYEIAECTDLVNQTWEFIEPKDDDIVFVINESIKYIYSDLGWRIPYYQTPLEILLEVFIENDSSINETSLIADVKTSIIDYYSDSFGSEINIRRSKIIDLVHNVEGVSRCRLLKPQSGVFFHFDINDFTQQKLLEYSPEWIYFEDNDITIKIFTME